MASMNLRQRHALGSSDQHRSQSSSSSNGGSGSGSSSEKKAADIPSSKSTASSSTKEDVAKSTPNASGNKRSLTFAIGGVLTLLGVAGYTFFRQPSVGIHGTTPTDTTGPVKTALESVATKHVDARKKLDGLPTKERRDEAKRLDMLTEEEVNAVLRAKEDLWWLESPDSSTMRLRVDTNQVSSNNPIEDYLAWMPLGTDSSTAAKDKGHSASRYMFSVFDGHAGFMCAEQLSLRLGTMLNESLGVIEKLSDKGNKGDKNSATSAELVRTIKQLERESGLDWDQIPLALTATFIHMDHQLVHGALAKYRKVQDLARMDELLGPAVSGSCGLVAVVDTKANEVAVGNAGDSRALLGVRLKDGRWKAVRLSEDQTAKNQNELARMAREHPGESSVIHRGRVLGGLMPMRAFGDCRYKWPLEAQQDLFPVLFSRGHRYATTPPNYITPPYVTAKPVIVKHQLNENDKFLVMASDGLYDQLSDDEVVDTVAQWYEANNGGKESDNATSLFTEDSNAATHLIRTALSTDRLGRRSDSVIRRLLAIPAPHSRRFRDDISVTIVTFDRD
ncbi:[Pyruvate dehydrogenase [acetyl-transferring]]-phosphatase 1, mitochondrial [Coemansia guatemalensis]|uniref:[Pyruvate dehydrogenase [acetyl-transferring]]-phosphatase 1, mitochondrial n=1 Tax=Coemansia guatemalensis TaxID=2761395 RepID=A0A9W8LUY0_9FUNG|nr:[Pyruvate dehydrogenase [acetyl-transferring]]-phosphatase 1, mitochondrial [Coemansia guatemalensis]